MKWYQPFFFKYIPWDLVNFHNSTFYFLFYTFVLGEIITFYEMYERVYFYVQSEQLESKWGLALAGDQSLLCILCYNNHNTCIYHNTKYSWFYCKWFILRLLTCNAYFSQTRLMVHLSPESVEGWRCTALHVIMPYTSPIDVRNQPRHPGAVLAQCPRPVLVKEDGEWTDGWLIICRALQPWGFGGPTCCKCCVERRTNPRICMTIERFLCSIFSFWHYGTALVFKTASMDCEELGVKSLSVSRSLSSLSLPLSVCRTPREVVSLAPLAACIGKGKMLLLCKQEDKLWRGDALTTGVCVPAQQIHVSIMWHYHCGKNIMSVLKTVSGQRTSRGFKRTYPISGQEAWDVHSVGTGASKPLKRCP